MAESIGWAVQEVFIEHKIQNFIEDVIAELGDAWRSDTYDRDEIPNRVARDILKMKDKQLLEIAAEQFLGKKEDEITETILQTLEGHLRAILGTLTVEEVYKDRDQFANLVREIAKPDVGKMGIEILSFTIKDVYDNVDYLASLGKSQTAAVKRDAEIGVAQANRDAGIREAECEKSAMDIKYSTGKDRLRE